MQADSSLWLRADDEDGEEIAAPVASSARAEAPPLSSSRSAKPSDFDFVMRSLCDKLTDLLAIPWVGEDRKIRALVDEMTRSDMEQINALADEIGWRVAELMAARGHAPAPARRPLARVPPSLAEAGETLRLHIRL